MKFLSYFFKKTAAPVEIELKPMGRSAIDPASICSIDSFRNARNSLDLYSRSISQSSSWFWRDSQEEESLAVTESDSSNESALIAASREATQTTPQGVI